MIFLLTDVGNAERIEMFVTSCQFACFR